MTHICVTADTKSWVTREPNPTDSWDQGDTAGEVSNVEAFVESEPYGYYGSSHGKNIPGAKVGDTLYAVVVDYESGCTFGRSGGHADVLDFFTDSEEAQTLADVAINHTGGFGFEHNGVRYSTSWLGYFEYLNSIDVWEITIKPRRGDPFSQGRHPGFKRGT